VKPIRGMPLLAVMLAACATITDGVTQTITVQSVPVDGVQCALTNEGGTYFVTTPGSVTVPKSRRDLRVTCKKDGYVNYEGVIASEFHGLVLGNIVAGGFVGAAVDGATGAWSNYGATYRFEMVRLTGR
jgi:hypothetical protein